MSKNHILVMSKFPRLGEVKTRMISEIGAENATAIHKKMAEHAVQTSRSYNDAECIVHIANASIAETHQWLGSGNYRLQTGNHLGERMLNAVQHSLRSGAQKIVIIGTDCPTLSSDHFQQAFDALDGSDLVYAPAHDGGYVLVGMKQAIPEIFHSIDWGTEHVLHQSLSQASKAGKSYQLLQTMDDVDFAQDVPASFL